MSARPWYPFYPADYLADTENLSIEAHGLYHLLLHRMWINGGKLPSDHRKLAFQTRLNRRSFTRIWVELAPFFVESEGEISNPRVTKELRQAIVKSDKTRLAANIMHDKRRAADAHADAHADDVLSQPQPQLDKDLIDPSLRSGSTSTCAKTDKVNGEDVKLVLTHLSEQTGNGFRWANPKGQPTAHARAVKEILKKGYDVEDCKTVIDRKVMDWQNDDKMAKFLTPSTLFRLSNFEKYLDQR